jgi:hypothetical protein
VNCCDELGGSRFVPRERKTPSASIGSESRPCLAYERERRRRKLLIKVAMVVVSGIVAFLAVRFGADLVLHWIENRLFAPTFRKPRFTPFPASTVTTAAFVVGIVAMIGAARAMWSANPVSEGRRRAAVRH